jgi:hypothetical protein
VNRKWPRVQNDADDPDTDIPNSKSCGCWSWGGIELTSAAEFFGAFLTSYKEARKRFNQEWPRIWATAPSWSQFMIWDQEAVIRRVAPKLGLKCHSGEPLHLDAVFHANTDHWPWFPMQVAIEHENAPLTFQREVQKLLSVRCRLKVGITYAITSHVGGDRTRLEDLRARIARIISEQFAAMDALIGEDSKTEYLFLIGSEEEQDNELRWYQLAFGAGQGAANRGFI